MATGNDRDGSKGAGELAKALTWGCPSISLWAIGRDAQTELQERKSMERCKGRNGGSSEVVARNERARARMTRAETRRTAPLRE